MIIHTDLDVGYGNENPPPLITLLSYDAGR